MAKYEITTELTGVKYDPKTDSYSYTETIKDTFKIPLTLLRITYPIKKKKKLSCGS